jgi:phytoene dehydrogenase-like protein
MSSPEQKSIVIIGAGISGLAAGIYARLNHFDVKIVETNHKAGGVCSSWERNGFSVNGSIHWLVGSAPGTDLHTMWKHLGVLEGTEIYNHDSFLEYRHLDGQSLHFYTNIERLEQHLLGIAPEDEAVIKELTTGVHLLAESHFPLDKAFELFNALDWGKMILGNFPAIMAMGKYNQISIRQFAQKFKSPVIRQALENFWCPDMAMTFFLMQLSYAHLGTAGYPLGGSGKFIEKLEQRYRDLGGELQFGSKVTKIMVEDDQAIGVALENGKHVLADYVISACDGTSVLFKMLDSKYIDTFTKEAYETLETFPSLIYFSAGINRTFEEVPSSIAGLNLPLANPIKVGNHIHKRTTFQIYNFDPTLAPEGKTLVTCMLDTDFEYWQDLFELDLRQYQKERELIASELIKSLELEFPGIAALAEFTDTATPVTFRNWTGNYRGSYEGWLPTPEAAKVRFHSHFKNLSGFYMSGHWVAPGGGMPPAAFTGRDVIQLICKKEKKFFETT